MFIQAGPSEIAVAFWGRGAVAGLGIDQAHPLARILLNADSGGVQCPMEELQCESSTVNEQSFRRGARIALKESIRSRAFLRAIQLGLHHPDDPPMHLRGKLLGLAHGSMLSRVGASMDAGAILRSARDADHGTLALCGLQYKRRLEPRGTMANTKTATLTCRINPRAKEALRLASEQERRSTANLIEVLVQQYRHRFGITIVDSDESAPPSRSLSMNKFEGGQRYA
jgi:hypothetical protein